MVMTAEKSQTVPAMLESLFVDALGYKRVEFAPKDNGPIASDETEDKDEP